MQKEEKKPIEKLDSEVRKQMHKELCKITGISVPLDGLICAITGELHIDVVKFDDMLKVPDGVSLANYLRDEFGQHACDLARDLI